MEKKMTVKDLMTTNVKSCRADADLASVAKIMWDCDCGTVPVVNEERKVTGMITDRDICIAAATRSTAPANIRVRDVTSGHVHTCFSEDDVSTVLRTMKERRVRRLPVLDRQGRLVGIVSLNDLVALADRHSGANVPGDEFLATLKSICGHSAAAVPA
jgi:CBS domain-containing protein